MAKSEQVSGWFLLAMSGIPEWEEALYLCCSQHDRDTSSWPPLCYFFSLPPFLLPCSPCPALADGFEPPVLQMGRSWFTAPSYSSLLLPGSQLRARPGCW